jgi:uncharacterized membrane protein
MFKKISLAILPILMLVAQPAHAIGIDTMFINFENSANGIIDLTQVVAYVIGLFLGIKSLFKFAEVSRDKNKSVSGPISTFLAGVALLYLGSTLDVLTSSVFTSGDNGLIAMPGGMGQAKAVFKAIFTFISMVGLIAIVRGVLILKNVGDGGAPKNATFSQGLVFLIGGLAAWHITATIRILASTFGLPMPF